MGRQYEATLSVRHPDRMSGHDDRSLRPSMRSTQRMFVRDTGTSTGQVQSLRTERALLPLMLSLFEETLPFFFFRSVCSWCSLMHGSFDGEKPSSQKPLPYPPTRRLSFLGPDETRRTWHLFPRS